MNDGVWLCTSGEKKIVVRCVGVVTGHALRRFVEKTLVVEPLSIKFEEYTGTDVNVDIRWFGSDYNPDGTSGSLRMQKRVPETNDWRDV